VNPSERHSKLRQLRKFIVMDSLDRKKDLDKLVKLVREDERDRTLSDLEAARARAGRE
jgi:hypothetical protein